MEAPIHRYRIVTFAYLLMGVVITGCSPSREPASSDSASTASPSTRAGTKRIVLLNNTDSPFWDAAKAGIEQAASDLKISDKQFVAGMDSNDGTEQGQIEKLRQYGTQSDIAAVIISPISATNPAIADELRKLKAKGVLIGCFDSDLSGSAQSIREFYVGTNNVQAGEVLATAANNLRPTGGGYVQFVGTDSQQNAIQRMDGFTSEANEKFVQKDRRLDDADRARARDNVRDSIDKYPDLTTLVGIWSYNAPAIVDVIKEKGVRDRLTILTFDAEQLAIQQMTDGMIDAMVVQNPFGMGYESVRYVFAKLNGDEETVLKMFPNMNSPGGNVFDTGLKMVVPNTDTPLQKEMFEAYGDDLQFMTLGEFKEWLAKYKLTCS